MLLPGLTSSGVADLQPKGKVTYVVDEGLVTFAKFSAAVLGVFILVGTYLFGIKLEVTVEKMGEAQQKLELASAQSATLIAEMERNRQTSILIIADMQPRSLTPPENVRLEEARKASPEKFRGPTSKLWPNGSTLRIKFLDGTSEQKDKFEKALAEWLRYANLRVQYVDSKEDAPVKVSFSDPGSWSAIGVDALAIAPGTTPSINLGFQDTGSPPRNYLHEIGHLLGSPMNIRIQVPT